VRARAKSGPSADLRPEVAEALGSLERSLGEVAEWERVLTTAGATTAESAPADVVLRARVRPQLAEAPVEPVADADPVVEAEAPIVPLAAPSPRRARRRLVAAAPPPPPAVPPPLTMPELGDVDPVAPTPRPGDPTLDVSALSAAPVAGGAFPEPNLDLSGLQPADPMATWVETTSSPGRFGLTPEAARRRRNGRILSWAGAVLLVAAVAYLLIPDHSPDRPSLVPSDSTSTSTTERATTTTEFGSQFSVPTLPPTTAPTAPAVVPTTPTTARATAKKKSSSTATTRPPATTVPAPATTATTSPPPRPTTTTTLPPPTTTTTIPIQTCPTVPGQRPDDC
jgi:hypothetical protein